MLWSLRWLGRSGLIRRIAYLCFEAVWAGRDVAISRGPLKGLKWRFRRGQQFWLPLGMYEQETAEWLGRNLSEGDVFFDVGANWGYFTLAGSRWVGSTGTVVSVEPIPLNQAHIFEALDRNGIKNVSLQKCALSAVCGEATFDVESQNANSHLSEVVIRHARSAVKDKLVVQTKTLDSLARETGHSPSVVKCDVEGAEMLVLEGARELIEAGGCKWIVSTHGPDLLCQVRQLFEAAGYDVRPLAGFDHELVCSPAPPGSA